MVSQWRRLHAIAYVEPDLLNHHTASERCIWGAESAMNAKVFSGILFARYNRLAALTTTGPRVSEAVGHHGGATRGVLTLTSCTWLPLPAPSTSRNDECKAVQMVKG